ncbi:MAG: alpha/beta fold hydrolase [Nitrospinota bacterium]
MKAEAGGGLAFAAGLALTVLLFAGGVLAAGPGAPEAPKVPEVEITWRRAHVLLPLAKDRLAGGRMDEALIRGELAALPAGKKFPAVLYLHGCSGLTPGNFDYMQLLADAGYAVVAPDSFARPGRPKTCDPPLHRGIPGAPFREVSAMRQEEIRFAFDRIREVAWVDQRNVFLMGHSQGGSAAAAYPNRGFRGVIVSGSVCQLGLNAPEGTPVLSVYSEDDPWRNKLSARGCEERAAERGRPIGFHLFEGDAHNLAGNARARGLILDFLGRHAASPR